MNSQRTTKDTLEDVKINVKLKLAALWAAFMFLYIYVDYFHLYMPNKIADILDGKVFEFDITQTFLLVALSFAIIPILMIFLSVALPAKLNRITNVVVASVHIPYMLFNLVGEAWAHMIFGAAVEVGILFLIIQYSWKWPRVTT